MVLDRYGHMFEGARRQAAETMDRVSDSVEIGRQMVVKTPGFAWRKSNADSKKPCEIGAVFGGDGGSTELFRKATQAASASACRSLIGSRPGFLAHAENARLTTLLPNGVHK
jgi:hypothetical protein